MLYVYLDHLFVLYYSILLFPVILFVVLFYIFASGSSHSVVFFAFSYPCHAIVSFYLLFHILSIPFCILYIFVSGSSLSDFFFHIRVIPFCCIIYIFVSRSSLFFLYIRVIPFCSIVVLFSYSGHPFLLYVYAFLYPGHLSLLYYLYLCILIIRFFSFWFYFKVDFVFRIRVIRVLIMSTCLL